MTRRKGVPEAAKSSNGISLVPSSISHPANSIPAGGAVTNAAGASNVVDISTRRPSPLKSDIDRLGKLQQILSDYKVQVEPFEVEADVLEHKILAACEELGPDAIHTDEGEVFRLRVSAKADKQQILPGGLAKVLKWIGQETFLLIARPTFEGLKGVLSEEQYSQVVKKEQVGKRSVKCVAKAAPEPLKAA